MPTYGYRCTKCANEFDVVERMADKPKGRCPLCGARGTRLFFPVGIVFKGTGFYKTDSRSDNRGATSDKPAATTPESSAPEATAPASGETAAPPGPSSSDGQPAGAATKATTKPAAAPPSKVEDNGAGRRKNRTS